MVMCVSPTHTSETDPVCLLPSVWQEAGHHDNAGEIQTISAVKVSCDIADFLNP